MKPRISKKRKKPKSIPVYERTRKIQSYSNILATAKPGLVRFGVMVNNKLKIVRSLRAKIKWYKSKGMDYRAGKLKPVLSREEKKLKSYKEALARAKEHYYRHIRLAREAGILEEVLKERDRKISEWSKKS